MAQDETSLEKRLDHLEEIILYKERRKLKSCFPNSPNDPGKAQELKKLRDASAEYSDEYGSEAEAEDENDPKYVVTKQSVFEEILFKIKASEIKFKRGMEHMQSSFSIFTDDIESRMYENDTKIAKTMKAAESLEI
jgi:hypothetical protein